MKTRSIPRGILALLLLSSVAMPAQALLDVDAVAHHSRVEDTSVSARADVALYQMGEGSLQSLTLCSLAGLFFYRRRRPLPPH